MKKVVYFIAIVTFVLSFPALADCHETISDEDYREAVQWYTESAEQGDKYAQYSLGLMYQKGEGVSQDYKEAVRWYAKSAGQGFCIAQYNLGVMYDNGQGVPQDSIQAYKWYCLSAAQGEQNAIKSRNRLTEKMTPSQIEQAKKLVSQWKPKE